MTARTRTARRRTALALALALLGAGIHVGPAAAAATSVAFAAQPPSEVVAATPFPVQPVVHVMDGGSPAVGETVTLSIPASGSEAGGTLSCTGGLSRVTNASGDATFAGCQIDAAGSGYILRATAGTIHADTAPFSVTGGPAARLIFANYPASTTYTRLSPQPVVAVQDAGGNVATYFPAITLTISRFESDLTCSSGLALRAVSGFAEFTGCEMSRLGSGYRLTADDGPGGLAPITGPLFDIVGGAPTQLRFCWGPPPSCSTTPPAGTTGGAVLAVQPRVLVTDAEGNLAVLDNSTSVTLGIAPGTPSSGGPGGLACASGLTVTVSSGTANVHGCRIGDAGVGYRLRATSTGLTSATSNPFTVVAGPPVKIGFVAAPQSVVVNAPFGATVAIQDAGGNTVTSGVSATIQLTLGNNPGATGFTCDANEVPAVGGVAVFTGCRINVRAGGFTLAATALEVLPPVLLAPIESAPFRAVDTAADITLTASRTTITWGEPLVLDLRIAARGASRTVRLEASGDGRTWSTIATGTTNAAGRATVPLTPDRNRYYRVAFDGASDLGQGTSNVVRVVVRQIALLRPTHNGRVTQVTAGDLIALTTTVRPARADLPRAKVRYVIYRLSGNSWRLAATRDVTIDASGRAAIEIQLGVGRWYIRSQALPTSANANSTWSPVEWYEVVPLTPG